MSMLFTRPTKVDMLLVGGGGSGGATIPPIYNQYLASGYNGSYIPYQGMGGGGGAGGSVVEYKDVWLTSDVIVTVGAGGAPGANGYINVNMGHDGGETSIISTVPGPFSGAYTAPGGESGGLSANTVDFTKGSTTLAVIIVSPSPTVIAENRLDAGRFMGSVSLTRYNRIHTSINAYRYAMKNFVGTDDERVTNALSIVSQPIYFLDPYSVEGPAYTTYSDTQPPAGAVKYDDYWCQMAKNPGRGNYNGSTGGFGGGMFATGLGQDQTTCYNSNKVEYNGQDGYGYADGYSTNKSVHPYGGGGGGGAVGVSSLGGQGINGAGNGASYNILATSAVSNTGGGGGGAHPQRNPGSGGSGLVVISWDDTSY